MAEGEHPEEDPKGRGRRHAKQQHETRRPGAQVVGVVDVARAGEDREDERQHLATRMRTADPSGERDGLVDQALEPQPDHERSGQKKPGIGDETRLVEHHPRCGPARAMMTTQKVPPGC